MSRVFLSIIAVVFVIGGALVFQATRGQTSTVLLPSEIARKLDENRSRIRVAGRVADKPIDYQVEPKIVLNFSIHDPKGDANVMIPVNYQGLKPDMFSVGRDVIIDGDFQGGVLVASKLLTQCPSKYEAPSPDQSTGAASYKP